MIEQSSHFELLAAMYSAPWWAYLIAAVVVGMIIYRGRRR